MDNNNPSLPNSFAPGSNFAFKIAQPNKEAMLNLVMQKKMPAPYMAKWGQVYAPPPRGKRGVYKSQTYLPPFDKSDFWINFPPMNGYTRTSAPFH